MARLKIKLIKSTIGRKKDQIDTVKALGLKKIGSIVEKEDTAEIKGMIDKISFMLEVKEI